MLPDLGHIFAWLIDLVQQSIATLPDFERREMTPPVLAKWPLTDESRAALTMMTGIRYPSCCSCLTRARPSIGNKEGWRSLIPVGL